MTIAAPPEQLSEAARSFLQKAHHDLIIGGERPGAADGRTFETLDPATGEPRCVRHNRRPPVALNAYSELFSVAATTCPPATSGSA